MSEKEYGYVFLVNAGDRGQIQLAIHTEDVYKNRSSVRYNFFRFLKRIPMSHARYGFWELDNLPSFLSPIHIVSDPVLDEDHYTIYQYWFSGIALDANHEPIFIAPNEECQVVYGEKVRWFFDGEEANQVRNELNDEWMRKQADTLPGTPSRSRKLGHIGGGQLGYV